MADLEQVTSIISGTARLHGVIHRASDPRGAFVFCDPFAEEKKCAHRVLVEAARAFADAGYSVLRFDYQGCGDSEGEFVASAPSLWRADIRAAVAQMREEGLPVGLLGLRLGATLAALEAEAMPDLRWLVLWEPVLSGRQFMSQGLRRSQIKAMLTDEAAFSAEDVRAAHDADIVDLDGYRITQAARQQVESLALGDVAPAFIGASLILGIGARDTPAPGIVALASAYPAATAQAVRQEPFWSKIGLVESAPPVQATLAWLQAHG